MKGARVYNTGKVLIGAAYVPPPQRLPVSRDMERLQTALLTAQSRPSGFRRVLARLFGEREHA